MPRYKPVRAGCSWAGAGRLSTAWARYVPFGSRRPMITTASPGRTARAGNLVWAFERTRMTSPLAVRTVAVPALSETNRPKIVRCAGTCAGAPGWAAFAGARRCRSAAAKRRCSGIRGGADARTAGAELATGPGWSTVPGSAAVATPMASPPASKSPPLRHSPPGRRRRLRQGPTEPARA